MPKFQWTGRRLWLVIAMASALYAGTQAIGQVPALTVDGAVPKRLSLSMEDLKSLRHERVEVSERGAFDAVRLATLLRLAGVVFCGEPLRGAVLTQAVLVTAADGYKVIFALAELVPSVEHPTWLPRPSWASGQVGTGLGRFGGPGDLRQHGAVGNSSRGAKR